MILHGEHPHDIFKYFIKERWDILVKKEYFQKPKPWTTDPILSQYRFCNISREDDAVTKWIRKNWSPRYATSEHLPLVMAVARFINVPDTLTEIKNPTDLREVRLVLQERLAAGKKTWGSAYIVSTNGKTMPKEEYICTYVLDAIRYFAPRIVWSTLEQYKTELMKIDGIGSFMAGQIIADLKWTEGSAWEDAVDRVTFVTPGPGSKRGLNRLYSRPARDPMTDNLFLNRFGVALELQEAAANEYNGVIGGLTPMYPLPLLDHQDIQNCLCEFDKYMRVLNGEGKPRQTYPGV